MYLNKRISAAIFIAVVAGLIFEASPARATFPGKNGRIAFLENTSPDIFSMNSDGSDVLKLTSFGQNNAGSWQSWSPDGRRLVFSEYPGFGPGQLWLMNADGSNQHQLLNDPGYSDNAASFSPDGSRVAFTRCQTGGLGACAIYRVQADGTGLTAITHFGPGVNDWEANYSPDGSTIVFEGFGRGGFIVALYAMNADGSNILRITPPEFVGDNPTWSPDGKKIAWSSHCCGATAQPTNLWVVNADGTGLTRLTFSDKRQDSNPSWSPDGTAITFGEYFPATNTSAIFVMNADGSGAAQVLSFPGAVGQPPMSAGLGSGGVKRIETGGGLPRWGTSQ